MGIIYELKNKWAVEAREKSLIVYEPKDTLCEVDYEDLDMLELAIKKAQEVRRDKK